MCNKKNGVTSITPDHGTPLTVTFDSFGLRTETLDTVVGVTGNQQLSTRQAAHLHGQNQPDTQKISKAAAGSGIAAGLPIHTLLRSQLPAHVLFLQTGVDQLGNYKAVSMQESLASCGISQIDLPFIAAALGFTARVVGQTDRESKVAEILRPENADVPLFEVAYR